ncbi:MAG TPA: DUF2235 domain-containing protein [Candidatus Binatia bacterium]|nr:DUF2235 domain-containing protein [Candidatus Binatia bacterium]
MASTWVICIDGTWNQPGQTDRDPLTEKEEASPSNVAKTWQALADTPLATDFYYGAIAPLKTRVARTGLKGEVLYLNGIGTTGTITRFLEGATGTGTSERIRDAYRFLAERYQDGDRLFGFGFSRGAFAIRSLAGLIDAAGLPTRRRALKEEEMLEIYQNYRDEKPIDQPHYGHRPISFDFLGIWDTVGALAFGRSIGGFHRINPGNVLRVVHALALDEERERFQPSYWDKPAGADTQIDEVWFSGCHTNIGGGYCDTNLSNIAFIWVLKAAQDAGISIDLRGLPEFDWNRSHTGTRRDSYSEFYNELGLVGAIARTLKLKRGPRAIQLGQRIHKSVIEIMQDKIAPGLEPYVPSARYQGNPLSAEVDLDIEPWGAL